MASTAAAAKPAGVADAYFSAATLASLRAHALLEKVPALTTLQTFAGSLADLQDKTGLVKPSAEAKTGTATATGRAASLVANLQQLGAPVDGAAKALTTVLPKVAFQRRCSNSTAVYHLFAAADAAAGRSHN